ncbi:hypothetical protein ACLK1T_18560 [Escherichia coli]
MHARHAIAKVTGRARYTDDYVMAGMCYAKYVRSPYRTWLCRKINDEQARSLPGVLAILPGKMCLYSIRYSWACLDTYENQARYRQSRTANSPCSSSW